MTRTRFHQELQHLRERLMTMGGMAELAVEFAVRAYSQRDVSLCELVLDGEGAINSAERRIDELSLDLLAMQQPMAVDLRLILAVTKCTADLERIGDQAVNIAQRVEDVLMRPASDIPVDLPRMAFIARTMLRRALNAFARADANEAEEVLVLDDELDQLNRDGFEAIEHLIGSKPDVARTALDILIIARNLERIGDHATNIAEDVIFWIRGADVRHHAMM